MASFRFVMNPAKSPDITKLRMASPGQRFAVQIFAVIAVLLIGSMKLHAQAVDYIYGIENSGPTWTLDQLTINYGAGTYTQQALVSLSSLIPGFNTSTQLNGSVNGLALDAATHTLFFTYSYNNNASLTAGTFTATSYAIQSTGPTTWSINQLYTVSVAAGTADAPGATNTAAKPGAVNVGSGWLPRGAYYNGAYYLGIQSENSLFKIDLANGVTSASTSQSIYSNINHGGLSAVGGGDMVLDSSGNLFVSGTGSGGETFGTTSLANAQNSAGSAWNATSVGDFYQLGGLGQSPRLYAGGGTSPFSLYEVTNFSNPSGSAPIFTALTLTSGVAVQYSDLSDGALGASIVIPEASTWAGGVFGILLTAGVCVRSFFKWRAGIAC